MRSCRAPVLSLVAFLAIPGLAVAEESVSEDQIAEAIALGKAGNVPFVKISKLVGDFDVYIAGPVPTATPYDHGGDLPMFSTSSSGEGPYRTFCGT